MNLKTARFGLAFTVGALLLGCRGAMTSPSASDLPQRVMPTVAAEKLCNDLFGKSKTGRRLGWKGKIPIVFTLDADFPTDFVPAIAAAMKTWNHAAGFELFALTAAPQAPSLPGNDGQNTIYFLKPDAREAGLRATVGDSFHEDGGIAATILNGRANEITDADLVFDGVNKSFTNSRLNVTSFDLETIALHELGHALGMAHNPDEASTMYYGLAAFGLSSRTLDETSVRLLDCEYR